MLFKCSYSSLLLPTSTVFSASSLRASPESGLERLRLSDEGGGRGRSGPSTHINKMAEKAGLFTTRETYQIRPTSPPPPPPLFRLLFYFLFLIPSLALLPPSRADLVRRGGEESEEGKRREAFALAARLGSFGTAEASSRDRSQDSRKMTPPPSSKTLAARNPRRPPARDPRPPPPPTPSLDRSPPPSLPPPFPPPLALSRPWRPSTQWWTARGRALVLLVLSAVLLAMWAGLISQR